MQLRNKDDGEIGRIAKIKIDDEEIEIITDTKVYLYQFLSDVCRHWEDYEEPKVYWYISGKGVVNCIEDEDNDFDKAHKEIGNYFETKEEAEKAVEKLKAWKRLKDKGFRFDGWEDSPAEDDFDMIFFTMKAKAWDVETQEEALDLLFGGEE